MEAFSFDSPEGPEGAATDGFVAIEASSNECGAPKRSRVSKEAIEQELVKNRAAIKLEPVEQMQETHPGSPIQHGGGKICPVCPDAIVGKKKYCPKHSRAHECVKNLAYEGTKPKKKKAKAKRRPRKKTRRGQGDASQSSSTESSDSVEIKTKEYMAYKEIFANKSGNPQKAAQILLDFCSKFPEGQTQPGKRRITDQGFKLISYTEAHGTRRSQEEAEISPKVDYEFFAVHMENTRRWKPEKIWKTWQELKSNPLIDRDEDGPAADNKLRLAVPGNLMGTDVSIRRTSNYEDHSATKSTKARKFDEQTHEAWQERAQHGFQGWLPVDFSKSEKASQKTLAGDIDPGAHCQQLLLAGADSLALDTPEVHAAGSGGSQAGQGPADSGCSVGNQKRTSPKKLQDIPVERAKQKRECTTIVEKMELALWKEIDKTLAKVDNEEYNIYEGRVKVALIFLGHTADTLDPKAPRGTPINLEGKMEEQGAASKHEAHTKIFQDILRTSGLPMEEPAGFMSLTGTKALLTEIGCMDNIGDIERAVLSVERQCEYGAALLSQIKESKKNFISAVSHDKKREAQLQKDRLQQDALETARRLREQQNSDRLIGHGNSCRHVFMLQWIEQGFESMQVVKDSAAMDKGWDNAEFGSKPFIVESWEMAKNILESEESTLKNKMQSFHSVFQHSGCQTRGYTFAPCEQKHGVCELAEWTKQAIHARVVADVKEDMPILFWGIAPEKAWPDVSEQLLGCSVMVMHGSMCFIAVKALDLVTKMGHKTKQEAIEAFKSMTAEKLAAWKNKVHVSHGVTDAGSLLVCPPGFFLHAMPSDKASGSGLLTNFLTKDSMEDMAQVAATFKLQLASRLLAAAKQ